MEHIEKYLGEVHTQWHGTPFSVSIVQRDGADGAWQERFFNYGKANAAGRMWNEDVSGASRAGRRSAVRLIVDNFRNCLGHEAFREHRGGAFD